MQRLRCAHLSKNRRVVELVKRFSIHGLMMGPAPYWGQGQTSQSAERYTSTCAIGPCRYWAKGPWERRKGKRNLSP